MKKIIYVLTLLTSSTLFFISCKKDNISTVSTTQTSVPFENTEFSDFSENKELFFKTNQSIVLLSTIDTIQAVTKTIDNIGAHRLFFIEDQGEYYKVAYKLYGDPPQSILAYVKKENLIFQDEYSLNLVNISDIRYSQLNGIYDDKTKTFDKYGTIKLISKELYNQYQSKGNTNYISKTKDVERNETLGVYQFTTNAGELVEIPIDASVEEENALIKNELLGFSSVLQSYVFKVSEEGDTFYSFYSKKNKATEIQYEKTLPIYNSKNQMFAQLYNDGDVGSVFVQTGINDELKFQEKLLVNFIHFHTIPNTLFWITDNTLISQVIHTNQKDQSKVEYVMIQLHI